MRAAQSGLYGTAQLIRLFHGAVSAWVLRAPLKQEGGMDRLIQSENIRCCQKLPERVTDESQRRLLLKLLSEEEVKSERVQSPKEG
jgi:hypothetical protein